MSYERLEQILAAAKKLHISLMPRIDFDKEDNKQAIYLIQGGVLTAVSTAFKLNMQGYMVPVSQQKRLIDEAIDLIWFFDENEEQPRQLKAWFDGHVVERTQGNVGNLTLDERAEKNFLKKEDIEQIQELQKNLKQITSKVMHPTINAMRATMRKTSHIFDYDNVVPKNPQYSPETFGSMFVTPSLYSLLVPVRHLLLDQSDFEKLRSYVSEIE